MKSTTGVTIELRLQTMFFFIFITVALVPVMFLAVWIQESTFKQEMDSVHERHLLLARNLTGSLSRYAMDVEAVFKDISTHLENTPPALHQELFETMGMSLIALVTPSGEILKIHYGEEDLLPATPLSQFLQLESWHKFNRLKISSVTQNRRGNPSIFLSCRSSNGNYFFGNLSTDYIIQVQKAVSFGEKGHAAIVDHLGKLLAHPKEEWQKKMKDLSKLAPVIQMVAGQTGVIQFFSPAVKADMVAGYSVVPSTGWGVMIPQPISEIEERAAQFYYLAFIVSFAGLVAAMLLGWWLSRYISKPIIATVKAASMLTKDIPSPQTKPHKKPIIYELKRLFESFNEMAEQVKKAHLTLEERVQERTLALKEQMEERKALEDKFRYMANHDKLTGLPNRNLFMDRLCKALQHGARAHHSTALFFIDLDGFKEVNDRLGHLAGDCLLVEVGKRIQRAVRENDTVGRYGGDEFTVLLVDTGNSVNIEVVVQKILDKIIQPIQIKTKEVNVSASIGIAMTQGGGDANMLIQEADTAMYKAKEKGKNCYQFA